MWHATPIATIIEKGEGQPANFMESLTSPLIIGVDTGNRCIKTANRVFVAGVRDVKTSDTLYREALTYNNHSYVLTSHRNNYMQDKTKTEDYFAMTLFAIQQELDARGVQIENGRTIPIVLSVGLPPRDFSRLKQKYIKYFSRGSVQFQFKGKMYDLTISLVDVYPQGISATYGDFETIKAFPKAYICDIGGITTDIIEINKGKFDPALCRSIDYGMIHFYNHVKHDIAASTGRILDEDQIDTMLESGKELNQQTSFVRQVDVSATEFVRNLANKLLEFGADLAVSKGIFVGGGSLRLQKYIDSNPNFTQPYFILDIAANAKGYEALTKAKLNKGNEV